MAVAAAPAPRRRGSFLWRHPYVRLALLLALPVAWLVLVYLGSLVVLFVNAFWRLDPFTAEVVREWGIWNFQTLWEGEVYRTIVFRTVSVAAIVTVVDALLALPIAFAMARLIRPARRAVMVVLVLLPLWSSYLVKVYAWRVMLGEQGILNSILSPFGLHGPGFGTVAVTIVLGYLWLPYMILPVYAGMERIPNGLLEASGDLGAKPLRTFTSVVIPLAFPAIVAGSIFTFSLTLGDYIAVQLVSSTQFIGSVVYANVGTANNLPLAAAFALVPVAIMIVYLLIARRLGAFEAL